MNPEYSSLCEVDAGAYSEYLSAFRLNSVQLLLNGSCSKLLAGDAGVHHDPLGSDGDSLVRAWTAVSDEIGRIVGRESHSTRCFDCSERVSGFGRFSRVGEHDKLRSIDSFEDCGISGSIEAGGGRTFDGSGVAGGVHGVDRTAVALDESVECAGTPSGVSESVDCVEGAAKEVVGLQRGKHWKRNRARRIARKSKNVDGSGGCVSDSSASIVTVDTRTGVEIEAAQTLAARRVVENKLAIARGEVQLRSYANKDKTKALERLDAVRMEQRINEAKAKSQASYKKCDESMKSLGSTGSAGEFALKQEVKRAKDNAAILAYVQAQADFMVKHVSPEVLAQVAAMPPPVLESEFDVFGDCPEDYTEDQRESYFLGLARQQEENDMRTGIPC